jgi:DUF1365 family protein
MSNHSAVFVGTVTHERLRPKNHSLRYRVFSMLVDIDELPALDKSLRLFGHNRAAVFSFHDADHGKGGDGDLRDWVEKLLVEAGIRLHGGAIRVLCYPRIFGYVFNPLTVFFCYSGDGALRAILYEVSNTHAEKHTYVIPVAESDKDVVRQNCRKTFFVSPFVEMDCEYNFRIVPPGEKVIIAISQSDRDGRLLSAKFSGARRPLTDATLGWALIRYPLMTLKIMAGIHWEAFRLWRKGIPVVSYKPAPQSVSASIVAADR